MNSRRGKPARCYYLWSRGCDPGDDRSVVDIMLDYPSAQFVCLRTMIQVGPDGELIGPDVCTETRGCFRAGED